MSCLKPEGMEPVANGKDGLDYNPFDAMQPRAPERTPARPATAAG